jgi:plasmid maintenance system antidote protein VapI
MSIVRSPENRPFRVALEANDMDRTTLAKRAGLHPLTISKVMAGQFRLSAATAARVAGILGSSAAALGLVEAEKGDES